MKTSKKDLGIGCGKVMMMIECGSYSLKNDEHYYCDECYEKLLEKSGSKE